ncbi:Ig-like domain-containing protein [Chitinophaga sancti]|uniref:Gliding motility-associated C-terminal domain-containing protein n=1 Tax=Chitinophaga sancti TaxID=1004 RepID=A0A1K1QMM8_9BACT|nr:Ig-like domain-containing protein [Chitinophaga sancti]WQD65089.1 Ig-like domain-containing protein [Chitinophaga sancti]WQG89287.1 Ig-like domain-containing protein [Chitinophaga sancti]SFW61207.1 gliding motility-associated C-terminal domain-containing protein [Chitinophaga sancti]
MNYTFTRCIRILLLIVVTVTAFLSGKAQSVLSTLETGGVYTAVAKDANNNIYATKLNSATNLYDLVKFTGGTGTPTLIYSQLNLSHGTAIRADNPWGIAVNANGDVFVLNSFESGNGQIIKLQSPSYLAGIIQTGKYFSAITLDKNNNLLAIEYDDTKSKFAIVKYPAGLESSVGTTLYDGIALPAAGTSYPWGLTTDSHGNIYFTDFMESAAHPAGAIMKLTYPGYAVSTLATGREFSALAMDASDNLYAIEAVRKGVSAVVKYTDPTAAGYIVDSSLTVSGIGYPTGLTVSSTGKVYVADGFASGNGRLISMVSPTVVSANNSGAAISNSTTLYYTVEFNVSVSGVSPGSFTLTTTGVTGASVVSVTPMSATTYQVIVNTGTGDGTIRLDVTGAGITPAMGNVPFAGSTTTIDKTAPVISLAINGGATVTNSTSITLSETATDADATKLMRFSLDSSLWTPYEPFAANKSYIVTPGEGLKKVYMEVTDGAGNVSGISASITMDLTPPVVTFTSAVPNITNQSSAVFQFTANEPVSKYEAKLDGGSYVLTTSPLTFTGLSEGPHTVDVRAVDIAGNKGSGTTYTWSVDQTAPTIPSISYPAAGTYTIGQAVTLTANMSEAVYMVATGSDVPYINITIGNTTAKAVYTSGTGTNAWTFTYTVQGGDLDNDGITLVSPLELNGNGLIDVAGNTLVPSFTAAASGINVNGIRPVATLNAPAASNASTITVTLGFDESVTGVNTGSLALSGITGASVTSVTPDATTATDTYTIAISVPANRKGTLHIALAADAATAVQTHNKNAAATADVDYDNTAPVITSIDVPADGYYKAGSILSFTARFDKNITVGTGNLYLPVTIGSSTVHAAYVSGSGTKDLIFSYTVVAGENDADGIQIGTALTADAGTLKDSYGNEANTTVNGAGATNGVLVNTIIPSVVLSSTSTLVNGKFSVTVTFSELVLGLLDENFTASNGIVSNDQTTDNIVYTIDVTPSTNGTVSIQLPAGAVVNIGDNGNSASNVLQVKADFTPPVVVSVDGPADGYYHEGDELKFIGHFSEDIDVNVVGQAPYMALNMNSGVVPLTYIGKDSTNGMIFSYTVKAGDDGGDHLSMGAGISIASSSVTDKAGNNAGLVLYGIPSLSGVKINTTHPAVTLSAGILVNGAYTVTATFAEAVRGLSASEFTVVNGTASNVQTSDSIVYTVTITPTGNGLASVTLPANAAENIARNGNLVSNTVNTVVDLTAPTVTGGSAPAAGYYKSGAVLNFAVNFSEVVNVTGTPRLAITMGSNTVYANYTGGTGTAILNFSYTVVNGDQDLDGIAIDSLIDGSIKDAAGNAAVRTLVVVNPAGVLVNTIAPVITQVMVPVNGIYNATQTLNFSVQFNRIVNVTGTPVLPLTIGSAVVNATYSAGTGTNTLTFSYAIQNGENDLDGIELAALTGTIKDQYGNDAELALHNAGSTTGVYVYTAKSTVILTSSPALVNGAFNITATFSEKVRGLAAADFTVTNGTAGTPQTSDSIIYTITITPTAEGNVTVTLPADVTVNKGNNGNTASNTLTTVVDYTAPVINVVTAPADGYYKSGSLLTFTVTYSEVVNVTGTPRIPFNIGNNLVYADYSSGTGSSVLTFTYTVKNGDQDLDGISMYPSLNATNGNAADAAGNAAETIIDSRPDTHGVLINTIAPLVSAVDVPVNGYYNAGQALGFTVHFNNVVNVTGAPVLSVIIGNATVNAAYTGGTGTSELTFSYTVQDGDNDQDGISLSTLTGTIRDLYGNDAVLTLNNAGSTAGVFVNTVHPTVTLSTSAVLVNGTFEVTASFSEAVTGVAVADFAVTNGVASNLQAVNNRTYTATITPSADGNVTVKLPVDIAVNIGNNGNTVSNTLTIAADITAPTVTSMAVPANDHYKAGDVLNFSVTFAETVHVTGTPRIAISMGSHTVYADYTSGSGTSTLSYSYTIVDGDQDLDGIVINSLTGGTITDAAGNTAILTFTSPNTNGVLVNTIAPVITQVNVPVASYYHAGQTLDFSVQFNANVNVTGTPVLPITIGSTVVNAGYTGGTGTNTLTFSYTVQDGENDLDGIVLSALTGTIQDVFGNEAVNTLNNVGSTAAVYVYTVHPTVVLSAAATRVNAPYTVTATFSEAVTGLALADFTVANGITSNLQTTDNIIYTFTMTPATDGNVTVSLSADAAVNVGSNGNTASNTLTVLADLTAPVVTNVTVPGAGYYKLADVLNFTVTFGETVNVTGTPRIAIRMGADTVYAGYTAGNGTSTLSFAYTIVNGDQDLDGIALSALTGTVKDVAGNDAVLSFTAPSTTGVLVNTVAPVITQVGVPANGYYHAGQTLDFTVAFNAVVNVTGTPVLPITIGSSTANATYKSGSGTNTLSFSYTVQDGDNDLDGIALSALTGSIQDVFGNSAENTLHNAGSTSGVYVYTVHPTVTLSTSATLVNGAFSATATFSEAVTGLTAADFTVTNSIAGNLQTSDNITYTLTITPTADGNVTVTLPADAVVNKGDNGNIVSNTLTVTSDVTAPVINSAQTFSIDEYSAAGTTLGTVTAVEATSTLQNWTITNDPSGAFAINAATGVLSVKDEAALNANVNATVSLTITVSDGLNVSNAATVAVSVIYVPLPPTDINLDNQTIVENTPVNTLVGHLSAVTAEPNPVYTYTLVTGTGSTDNASFTISGNQLLTGAVLDYDVKNIYTVRIRATLANGLYTEKAFTLQLGQVNQAPIMNPVADQEVCDMTTAQTIQTSGASAVEDGQTLSYTVRADQPFFTSLVVNANGLITYHLQPNISGTVHVTVTLKDNGGTAYGGVDTLASTFAIKVNALPTVTITADQDTVISKGTAMNLAATGGVNYEWSNASGIVSGQQTATLQIKPVENTVYAVTVTDNKGCVNEGAMTITVVNEFKIDATNLLTPNGDGVNDKWIINDLSRYPNNDLTIYDRSGRVVYRTKNYSNNWDATYNGSPLAEGTYYYILKADGYNTPAKGFISIIRDQH